MKIKIEHAIPKDADKLTQIAFAAKSFWGYPEEYLKLWKDDLTIPADYVQKNTVLIVKNEKDEILGFGAIEFSTAFNAYEIGHMWVFPEYIGNGLGRFLLNALINQAQKAGITQLYSVSDPNAQGVYEKMGFVLMGQRASQPKGRYLPVLVVDTRKIVLSN